MYASPAPTWRAGVLVLILGALSSDIALSPSLCRWTEVLSRDRYMNLYCLFNLLSWQSFFSQNVTAFLLSGL